MRRSMLMRAALVAVPLVFCVIGVSGGTFFSREKGTETTESNPHANEEAPAEIESSLFVCGDDDEDDSMMVTEDTERDMANPIEEDFAEIDEAAPSEGAAATAATATASSGKRKRVPKKCPATKGRWANLSEQQREFCMKCRAKSDSGGKVTKEFYKKGLISFPDNPALSSALVGELHPGKYTVSPVFVWDPISIWGRTLLPSIPCPSCKTHRSVDAGKAKWAGPPRFIFGVRYSYLLDTKTYKCGDCNKWFKASNPDSVALLPDACRAEFKIFMGPRFAVDDEVAVLVNDLWFALSSRCLADMLNRFHRTFVIYFLLKP